MPSFEQLATDALGTPAWVAPRHLADERGTRRRRSSRPPRATPPERAESCAMPTENGRGLDEQGCFTPSWRDSRGENNREALPGRPPDAPGKLPLGDDELLSEKRVLGDQFGATANEIRGQSGNESKKIDHGSSLTPSARMTFVARTTSKVASVRPWPSTSVAWRWQARRQPAGTSRNWRAPASSGRGRERTSGG